MGYTFRTTNKGTETVLKDGSLPEIYSARGCTYDFDWYDLGTDREGLVVTCFGKRGYVWSACMAFDVSAERDRRVIDVVRGAREISPERLK
jgi:hypothetical protein